MKVDGTFDIECAEWTRFVVGSTYERDGGIRIHTSIADLTDHLTRRPGLTWWAHCGGVYDFLPVIEEQRRRGVPMSGDQSGSRISRVLGGGVVLRDSYPLIPLELWKAVELIGESQMEFDSTLMPCTCMEPCGGYCAMPRAFRSRKVWSHVAERCASDARQLYFLLRRIEEIGSALDLDMRGTIGGTAWATARARLGLPDAKHSPSDWRRLRRAYYGGRVAIVRPVARQGRHYDISSCYPHALATVALPSGYPESRSGSAARRALESDSCGVFSATVTVPDLFIPPLPVREPKRIVYPVGTFRGTWTGLELRAAMERGVKVNDVRWAIVWPSSGIRFRSLILEWWEARKRAGKDSALGAWLRLLQNSITGKLAENPSKRAVQIYPKGIRFCEAKAPCTRFRCTGSCGAYTQMDQWGQIWSVPIHRPSSCSHIEWAAHLTSAARIQLLEGMESQGANLVYSDTDSVWTIGNRAPSPLGDNLGDWEYKSDFSDFECAAPRQYRYTTLGKRTVKTAGITISSAEYGRRFARNDRGVLSFSEAAAVGRGLFQRRNQNWNLSDRGTRDGFYGDRRMSDSKLGYTYPLRYRDGEQKNSDEA